MRKTAQGIRGGEHAGTTTGTFFGAGRMRRAVGAQKVAWITADRGVNQRLTVFFTFQDWQTIVVGTNGPDQHMVTVQDQMMGRDAGGQVLGTISDVSGGIFGGNMFHGDPQLRQSLPQGIEDRINEHFFPIKNIDARRCDLAMNTQRQTNLRHFFKHGHDGVNICDTAGRIGGCTGGVQLYRVYHAFSRAQRHIIRLALLG